ncbi:hypothetical protein [Aureispira sp. CCB-E]|uniref:hypothetical protein n=1 Tax=Aureispira sp. CCB-E TaxID=3051121 RepID=UPI00286934BC|nr:hypothetical protein [Aureispira sp. CCB-E]WMX13163.1 hypothetical protein QP953_20175 [Aureispira sp. CCB-E]
MKLIFFIAFLYSTNIYSQNSNIEKQLGGKIQIAYFHKHNCENIAYPSNKLLFSKVKKDTLELKLQAADNCSIDFLNLKGKFKLTNDTLNLFYEQIHPGFDPENPDKLLEPIPEAECDCQFWLDYKIVGWKNKRKPLITFFNKKIKEYIGYEIIGLDTLNKIDLNGNKQGKWLISLEDYKSMDYRFDYFENDIKVKSERFQFLSEYEIDPKTKKFKEFLYSQTIENHLKNKGVTIIYSKSGEEKGKFCYLLSNPDKSISCE